MDEQPTETPAAETATPKPEPIYQEAVYGGRIEGEGGKLYHAWMGVTPGPLPLDDFSLYAKINGYNVGSIYRFRVETEGGRRAVITGGIDAPRYLRMERSDRVRGWDARSRALETQREAARDAKKQTTEIDDAIRSLAWAYGRLHTMGQRRAFLAYVIAGIFGDRRG